MNRRNFLASLLATATLDPERLLWRPGAKLISIPKPQPLFSASEVYAIQLEIMRPHLEKMLQMEAERLRPIFEGYAR